MGIERQVDVLIKGRLLMLKAIEGYSLEQVNKTPKGFNNNIGWNIGHLVVTQQLLCYKLSGEETLISEELIERYKKGTAPVDYIIDNKEWELLKTLFLALPGNLQKDYDSNLFTTYNEYTTSVNVTIDNIEKAIDFNNFHEGIHLGVLLCLKKLV